MAENNTLKNATVILSSIVVLVIAVGSILLATGSVVGDIDQNKDDIGKLETLTGIHTTEIVQAKLAMQKQAQTATSTLNVLSSVNSKLDTIQKLQGKQATDIALIKQKMKIQGTE
jgi:hypothetical protein